MANLSDNILIDFGQQCRECCACLGDYTKISIDDLANNYIKATNENNRHLKDVYISALILRFWSKIKQLYNKTKSAHQMGPEDFITIIYNRIEYACKYHAWTDPEKNVNAEACINRAISTEALNMYYFSNLDKYRANANALSIEMNYANDEDNDTISDILEEEDPDDAYAQSDVAAKSYIQSFIDKNKVVEAIILDTIAFSNQDAIKVETTKKKAKDSNDEEYKYKETYTSFNKAKTVNYLAELPETYDSYFKHTYSVKPAIADVAFSTIRAASKPKLNKYVNKTLEIAKTTGF